MHDLLFTRPGDDYPFGREVRVSWSDRTFTLWMRRDGTTGDKTEVSADEVDSALDDLLARLVDNDRVCRRCGREVSVSADQFEVFEKMHYVCFHYEFEHDPTDPDTECTAGGCPSANLASPPSRT